ncbi:MAG: hypothetical protein IKB05_00840 [Alphaproteobacteria bacterium]|nr:hypothetical protein [Alphaproteobacteria bacterium]
MAKNTEYQTNVFTIAHYILLFMVTVTCASIVTWLILDRYNTQKFNSTNITYIMNNDPCVKQTRDAVSRMWSFNQELIPTRYKTIADAYSNDAVLTRITGYCDGVPFMCRAGQLRRTCDPCAIRTGRHHAMEMHIADMIRANCGYDIDKK